MASADNRGYVKRTMVGLLATIDDAIRCAR